LKKGVEDLDLLIGDEEFDDNGYDVKYKVRKGLVEEWEIMERFMEKCIFKYISEEKEDKYLLIKEKNIKKKEKSE
jgi:actin-related protein 3